MRKNQDISKYFDKPCKFRLKSGKEVFGVLWKSENEEHFFASPVEYLEYLKMKSQGAQADKFDDIRVRVNLNEFISAERIL